MRFLLRRVLAAMVLPAVLVAAGIVFWTEQSVAVAVSMFNAAIDFGERFEDLTRTDVVDRSDVPGTIDQLGHALFWGCAMLVLGWVARFRVPVPLTTIFVLGASMAFEFLQPVMSTARRVQPRDIVANSVGIAVAATVLIVVISMARLARFANDRARV